MKMHWLGVVLGIVLTCAGCQSGGGKSADGKGNGSHKSPVGDRVIHVDMTAVPMALSLDSKPGPDGVGVTLYLFTANQPKAAALVRGRVQFILIDGIAKNKAEVASAEPLVVWTRGPEQVAPYATKKMLGVCYPIPLNWGQFEPTQDRVTVAARYLPPEGEGGPIYSAPVAVTINR